MMQDIKHTLLEVVQAMFPLTLAIVLITLIFVDIGMNRLISFLIYTILATLGMALFLIGVKLSMLPIGEAIGADLPKHNSLWVIILVVFILSFLTTVAEPNVRVLVSMIDLALQGNTNSTLLIISIAFGVAFLLVVSILRIIYGVPIKYLFSAGYLIVLILSFFVPDNYLTISFDAGSVTTGPMVIPVIMALGIGVASVLEERSELDGFGLIGLASIGPIISIMLLGVLSS